MDNEEKINLRLKQEIFLVLIVFLFIIVPGVFYYHNQKLLLNNKVIGTSKITKEQDEKIKILKSQIEYLNSLKGQKLEKVSTSTYIQQMKDLETLHNSINK